MKYNKRIIIDILILVIPVIIMIFLMPVLPEKVPIQWTFSGENKFVASRFIDKKYAFLLGLIPFVLYQIIKFKYGRK
ncbi:MAG TPA: DUF1648 domain-containing protein [Clostridiaceae bacterium]|nr:DUF1648 domain-containing protein [Clostridiaceae bacterium]